MNNLHITLTEFKNESRILKQTTSLVTSGLASKVFITALHTDNLKVTENICDSIVVNRFRLSTRQLNKSLVIQAIKYLEYSYRIFVFYRRKEINVINVHALGLLPLGVFLKFFYKAKLIYDTHELETETNGLANTRKKLSKFIERRLIKYVDMTLVVGENIADWYEKEYMIYRPTVVMNAPLYQTPPKSNIFREKFAIRDDQMIFLYQGGFMEGRGINLLLESFLSRKNDEAVIIFMGYGELKDIIVSSSRKSNKVFYHKAVAPDEVLNYTVSADIGFSFIENVCLSYYYCMPNKLFEYTMAGLPVLASNMKEMREFIERYDIGMIVESETVECINEAVDDILKKDLREMKINTKKASAENSWEYQGDKMLLAYRNILNNVK